MVVDENINYCVGPGSLKTTNIQYETSNEFNILKSATCVHGFLWNGSTGQQIGLQ